MCIATFGVFWFRIIVTRFSSIFGGIAAGVLNAIAILVFNTVTESLEFHQLIQYEVYRKVALWLTEWGEFSAITNILLIEL